MNIQSEKKSLLCDTVEELKNLNQALAKTNTIIMDFEKKYNIDSQTFLKKFVNQEIEETSDFFDWYSEMQVKNDIEKRLSQLQENK